MCLRVNEYMYCINSSTKYIQQVRPPPTLRKFNDDTNAIKN